MYLLMGDKECRRKFRGPSFTFCYDENKYANIVNNTIPFRENPTIKQKRRELFHLLVFLGLSEKYKNYAYSLSESPDFVLSRMWFGRRTGLEVTEVIGDKASYTYTQKKLDELLVSKASQSERLRQKSYVGSLEALERIVKNKNMKLKGWKANIKRKAGKNVLLCVTYEPLDNPSCLMG